MVFGSCAACSKWREVARGRRSGVALRWYGYNEDVDTVFRYVRYNTSHLPYILELCQNEGWLTHPSDPARADRAFRAPGVTTVVALQEGIDTPLGFAQLLSDGEVQAYLALLLVDPKWRHQGIATALTSFVVAAAGGSRIDLLADPNSVGFYESFPHKSMIGLRIYPELLSSN